MRTLSWVIFRRAKGSAEQNYKTVAMAKGWVSVGTVGTPSAVSDPSDPMANCEIVLSLMFVT